MAAIETKIAALSGRVAMMQSALEGQNLSDEMRVIIRRAIEKTLEALHIKAIEEKEAQENRREKEITEQKKLLNNYIRQYEELRIKAEEEKRKVEANRQFYAVVMNMGYALNGIPRWDVRVMSPPPERALDERAFTASLRQKSNDELLFTVTHPYLRPKVNPEMATVHLRTSVLEMKEILRRAGGKPDDGKPTFDPTQKIKMTTPPPRASARFNARR